MIPYTYIGGAVAAVTIAATLYHYTTVSSLKASIGNLEIEVAREEQKLDMCKTDVIAESLNYNKCSLMLTKQNLAKAEVQSKLDKKKAEYDKLKNNPEVIYNEVIKYLPRGYEDEDCKTILNSLDGINLNQL